MHLSFIFSKPIKKGGIDIDHILVIDSESNLNNYVLLVLPRKGIEHLHVNMVNKVVKL